MVKRLKHFRKFARFKFKFILNLKDKMYKELYNTALTTNDVNVATESYLKIVNMCNTVDYLLLDSTPTVPKDVYIKCLFNVATIFKEYGRYSESIRFYLMLLEVDFDNQQTKQQMSHIYSQMCNKSFEEYTKFGILHNLEECVKHLQKGLYYYPDNPITHFNLGLIYQRMNNLEQSKIHYIMGITFINTVDFLTEEEKVNLRLNSYNGVSSIYKSLKKWPQALFYLLKAKEVKGDDPDINNQLGVVYTEMRRTDLGEECYKMAIMNSDKTFISSSKDVLLADVYLNYGHLHSYNGDNLKSIECYNKSLNISPLYRLPFQNKLMNLNYIFDLLPQYYITEQHKLINLLFKEHQVPFNFPKEFYETEKINIGIVSGDFVNHPVSYFISPLLKNFSSDKFSITCYSESIIDTSVFNKSLKFKLIKGMSKNDASQLIYNDNIHILIDLAGHTALNRIDIFSMKPSPIQVNYIGYPFTSGLDKMDYRITDEICDDINISQKYYTEKLVFMKDCFTCYDPGLDALKLLRSHSDQKGFLRVGCFNRLNKISGSMIEMIKKLLDLGNVKCIFKTKGFMNNDARVRFLEKFNKKQRENIVILDCSLTHLDHLQMYNEVDVSLDTFPYSGTTTTCESLMMGRPVFSVYDDETCFHPQNVSCSILRNSGLDNFVCNSKGEVVDKIKELTRFIGNDKYWVESIKETTKSFLTGKVCNTDLYINNIEELFNEMYENQFKNNCD